MTDATQQPPKTQSRVVHPHPSCLPQTLTRSFLVLGVETDAWVQIYADRIFIGVSQIDRKVGTYLLCEAEQSETNPRQTEYNLSTLLGNRDDAMLGVYARTITERIQAFHRQQQQQSGSGAGSGDEFLGGGGGALDLHSTNKPPVLLLGISLHKEKGNSPEMFRNLVSVLVDMYVDAIKDKTLQE